MKLHFLVNSLSRCVSSGGRVANLLQISLEIILKWPWHKHKRPPLRTNQKYFFFFHIPFFPNHQQQSLIKNITLRLSLTLPKSRVAVFIRLAFDIRLALFIWTEQENVWLRKKNSSNARWFIGTQNMQQCRQMMNFKK